jgi:hypothetical protein
LYSAIIAWNFSSRSVRGWVAPYHLAELLLHLGPEHLHLRSLLAFAERRRQLVEIDRAQIEHAGEIVGDRRADCVADNRFIEQRLDLAHDGRYIRPWRQRPQSIRQHMQDRHVGGERSRARVRQRRLVELPGVIFEAQKSLLLRVGAKERVGGIGEALETGESLARHNRGWRHAPRLREGKHGIERLLHFR